ncbi:MAG TPA: hypothetical protein VF516_10065 [Kofleriaceae bacterium]
MREMERRREVILTAMNNLGSRTRTFVIAVRDRIELGGYRSSCVGSCDWDAHNPTGQPGLGLEIDVADRNVINRAMARLLSVEVIAHPPEWLSQGIVEYFNPRGRRGSSPGVRDVGQLGPGVPAGRTGPDPPLTQVAGRPPAGTPGRDPARRSPRSGSDDEGRSTEWPRRQRCGASTRPLRSTPSWSTRPGRTM